MHGTEDPLPTLRALTRTGALYLTSWFGRFLRYSTPTVFTFRGDRPCALQRLVIMTTKRQCHDRPHMSTHMALLAERSTLLARLLVLPLTASLERHTRPAPASDTSRESCLESPTAGLITVARDSERRRPYIERPRSSSLGQSIVSPEPRPAAARSAMTKPDGEMHTPTTLTRVDFLDARSYVNRSRHWPLPSDNCQKRMPPFSAPLTMSAPCQMLFERSRQRTVFSWPRSSRVSSPVVSE
mmetsp:Transcript_9431/g.24555  ORF Transcript_9431/g.24555 Transcript_9431/m.24555 type:complete len:241 (-) Transcript_9431:121-843(-)